MEETMTAPIETEVSQPQAEAPSAEVAQPKQGSDKSETLAKLLKKEKNDPNVKFSDSELDILDEHYSGKLKPPPKIEEKVLSEEKDDFEESEKETDSEDEEDLEEENKVDPDLEKALKEVGAKNVKDLLDKVAGLKKLVGGRDAQAVAKLSKELESFKQREASEMALWSDLKRGVPEAMAEMQRRGLTQIQGRQPEIEAQEYIDEDAFIDPDSAKAVNASLKRRDDEIKSLKALMNDIKGEKDRYLTQTATTQAEMQVIDEMVTVAQNIPELKGVQGLRDAIRDFHKGQSNPKLEVFNELFQIADEANTDLLNAYYIHKGRNADREILQARQLGVKQAYTQKSSPNLSDIQTGDEGTRTAYKQITEQDLEAMEQDPKLMPAEWFDKNDDPIKVKIPKRAWKFFGL